MDRESIKEKFLEVTGKLSFEELTIVEKAIFADMVDDWERHNKKSPILNWSHVKFRLFLHWQAERRYNVSNMEDTVRWACEAEFEDWYWSIKNKGKIGEVSA